jgi:hypothetical protein
VPPGWPAAAGPFPWLRRLCADTAAGLRLQVERRDRTIASIDQPEVTNGRWVRRGGVVVERSFAAALGVRVGEPIVIGGRSLRVVGIAVSAAMVPYPSLALLSPGVDGGAPVHPGLVWATVAEARSLSPSPASLS